LPEDANVCLHVRIHIVVQEVL